MNARAKGGSDAAKGRLDPHGRVRGPGLTGGSKGLKSWGT